MLWRTFRTRAPLLVTLGATTAYAVLRYNVFQGVRWAHLPLFVLNKSIAWSSIVLFALAAWQAVRTREELTSNARFHEGSALAGLHLLMSLVLLTPAYFPSLFDPSQQLTLSAEFALLGGVLGVLFALGARRAIAFALLLPFAVITHTTLLGAKNWISPGSWPGYLIPITLLSSLAALATIILTIAWALRRAPE